MVWLVKLIGILLVVAGAIFMVKPVNMKKVMHFWMEKKRIYAAGVINILIGVIFLFAASGSSLPWFVILMGIASLIKGALSFVMGPAKIMALIDKIEKKPLKSLRSLAIIPLVLGILLVYAA
ncbi:MAG: hypothetical protein PHU64_01330 [Candidatus Omnitrophica bacterium]|nr:hypothetical protein [Candidatus Omnitrophota bacterium]MDD5429097.1 hypothetical protein [Candidatus Omnitrophota bacterium]